MDTRREKNDKNGTGGILAAIGVMILFIAYLMGWVDIPDEVFLYPLDTSGGSSAVENSEPESLPVSTEELKIHIIDVGKGDCVLIQAPAKTILIDTGEEGYGPIVMGYLDNLGIDSIDVIIATHPHSDHIGDMDYVIKKLKKVGVVYMAETPESMIPTTRCYENLLNAIIEKNAVLKTAAIGSSLKLSENGRLTFMGPVEPFEDYNNNSLVSRIAFGNRAFLFGGDSSREAEELLLKTGKNISCDYMHIAHHGSSSSTTQAYLDAVDPAYATISCGEDNSYGHPNRSVIKSLEQKGVKYYRTDLHGNILVVSDGEKIKITTEK